MVEFLVAISIVLILLSVVMFSVTGVRENSAIKDETLAIKQMELNMKLYLNLTGHFPEGSDPSIFPDTCSICRLAPGASYDLAAATTEWNAAVDAMIAKGIISTPVYTDRWDNPYGYDNNYGVNNPLYWSMVCSMGPDGVLQTFLPPTSNRDNWVKTNSDPQTLGDDICVFF